MSAADSTRAEAQATLVGLLVALAAAGTTFAGSVVLDRAEVGSAVALQEHEGLRLLGMLVIALSGGMFGAARIAIDRRWNAEGWIDQQRLWLVIPALAVLTLTLPAVVGWDVATRLGDLPAIGDGLTGAPAAIAAGAAAWALGFLPTLVLRYRIPVRAIVDAYEQARSGGRRP